VIALALLPLAFADRALVGTTGSTDLHDQAAALGGTARGCFHSAGVCVLHFDGDAPLDALAALGGVRYAVADTPMLLAPPPAAPAQPPSDASGTADCPDLWDLDLLEAEAVWARVRGAEAPVIAVQDGGFLESHVELADRVSGRFDYGDWDTTPEVETQVEVPAHGTFIAAMLAGVDDNDAVRAGLAPDGLLNLQKIADSDGALYWSYAISAMADLADGDLGVRVLNYSLGSHGEHQGFEDAVEALGHAGILVVTAAGNCSEPDCSDADNDQYPMIPAGYPFDHVVAVAGTQRDDTLNPYSHYGAISVDLGAPGVDLCSAGVLSDTDSYTAGGTSYATPLVAAAAALIWELHQELTPTELARVLRASALDVPELAGKVRSGGRLDVLAALDTAVPRLEAPPDVFVDGTGELALQLMNPAATGDGMLVLFHGPELVIDWADEDWSVQPFSAGETLSLPGRPARGPVVRPRDPRHVPGPERPGPGHDRGDGAAGGDEPRRRLPQRALRQRRGRPDRVPGLVLRRRCDRDRRPGHRHPGGPRPRRGAVRLRVHEPLRPGSPRALAGGPGGGLAPQPCCRREAPRSLISPR